ncbi:MAG TPA: hypothetical protein VLW50_19715 [Streptosporangiaceae bacterium]|nr:hypothetical protein [Streptosporangiaceae bacterium]
MLERSDRDAEREAEAVANPEPADDGATPWAWHHEMAAEGLRPPTGAPTAPAMPPDPPPSGRCDVCGYQLASVGHRIECDPDA